VHRCGILVVQSRASQSKNFDVGKAVADLLAMIDKQASKEAGEVNETDSIVELKASKPRSMKCKTRNCND
jgi:hypothetical protein